MKNRAVCRALVCALSLTLVAPPTIGQQYIDPLTQRFDQAPASGVVQPASPRPNVVDVVKDTAPQTGAPKAAVHVATEEQARQSVASSKTTFTPSMVTAFTAVAIAIGFFIVGEVRKDNKNDDAANLLAATSGTTGTR